jgi:hypothetical protein
MIISYNAINIICNIKNNITSGWFALNPLFYWTDMQFVCLDIMKKLQNYAYEPKLIEIVSSYMVDSGVVIGFKYMKTVFS